MSRIKYAYLIADLGNGGQEKQLIYLLTLLTQVNERALLIVWNNKDISCYYNAVKSLNVELIIFDDKYSFLKKVSLAAKQIKFYKPLIFHSYSFFLNFACWLCTLNNSTVPIGGIRNAIIKSIKTSPKILGFLCVLFPRIKISNSHNFKKGLQNSFLRKRLKSTFIVTNHLDVSSLHVNLTNIKSDVLFTASIGRLYPEKRIDIMIESIKKLVDEGVPVMHYHAGKGPLHNSLVEKIGLYNLQDTFILTGEVSDINAFLYDKSLFIHTSDFEGFPNVIMEAMACGKPVVSTDCGDAEYLVKNDENGFIVPLRDADAVSTKCYYILKDFGRRMEMGENSRKKAEQMFDLNHLLTETLSVYNKAYI